MLAKLKAFIDKNYLIIIGQVVAVLILVWIYGCESKVTSLNGPELRVTRTELNHELEQFLALANIKFAQLDKQDEFKRIVFNNAVILGSGGTVNPIGIITALFALTGLFVTADDIRLRKERKKLVTYTPNAPDSS